MRPLFFALWLTALLGLTACGTMRDGVISHPSSAFSHPSETKLGSANFDPRSRKLNTEIGVMIDSAPLAEVVLNGIAPDFAPSRSWRLEYNLGAATGPIAWIGEVDGEIVRLETEPNGDLWRGLITLFYGIVPGIEELL